MKRIYSEELRPIFQEKGIKKTCKSCGQNELRVIANFATLILQDTENAGLASYPIVALEYRNCGLLRFYGREKLGINDTTNND